MDKQLQKIIRKNNISAWFFLWSAILTITLTVCFVALFAMIFGVSELIIDSGVAVTLGEKYINRTTETTGFLFASRQLYGIWIICALAVIAQILAFILMKGKSRHGRKAGIAAFFVVLLTFPPVALLLIYPFAFLAGNNGKYFYQQLIEK